jgi:imidazolonepropionase-like amidohydrolase
VLPTRNGAKAMGREHDFGTVEAGRIAHLLVLTGEPRTACVRFDRSPI